MTKPIRPDDADLVDAPFFDDAERAESAWLLARDDDPTASPPSAAVAHAYAEMERLLGALPAVDTSWHDDVLRRLPASARPRPWWLRNRRAWWSAGALAAAAVVVLLLWRWPATPELAIAMRHVDAHGGAVITRSAPSDAVVGDRLIVTARPRGTGDLRVYRAERTLVARCPDGPGCTATGDRQVIEQTLEAPGQYQVLLIIGMRDAPHGEMSEVIEAARASNARIVTSAPIDVR